MVTVAYWSEAFRRHDGPATFFGILYLWAIKPTLSDGIGRHG